MNVAQAVVEGENVDYFSLTLTEDQVHLLWDMVFDLFEYKESTLFSEEQLDVVALVDRMNMLTKRRLWYERGKEQDKRRLDMYEYGYKKAKARANELEQKLKEMEGTT